MNLLQLLEGDDHDQYRDSLSRWQPRDPDDPKAVMYLRVRTDEPRIKVNDLAWQERKWGSVHGQILQTGHQLIQFLGQTGSRKTGL